MIKAVFFDVGETLVCEDRVWRAWAEWYGVPPLTFMGVLGAVIERRAPLWDVFEPFDPAFSRPAVDAARAAAGKSYAISAVDLYDDAVPCLRALKSAGYLVGVSGNQPPEVSERLMHSLGLDLDVIASSAAWASRSRTRHSSPGSRPSPGCRLLRSRTSATASTTTCCRPRPRG